MSSATQPKRKRDPEWITTIEAARLLSLAPQTLYQSDTIRDAVKRQGGGKSGGLLWFVPDLEAIVAVRRRFKLRTVPAARLVRQGLRA